MRRAIQRAAYLTGLSPVHAEPAQVVHYDRLQEYRLHYDYIDPTGPTYAETTRGRGNRLVSVFIYLSDCQGGGCTNFPNVKKSFTPEVGSAVVW